MNIRRNGASYLTCSQWLWLAFGLVLMAGMLLVVPDLWAQEVPGAAGAVNPYSFPYMDPSTPRAKMLANAFGMQMQLFMAGTTTIPILTMLGIVAALIGAVSLVFTRTFSPSIVASWLLVVIIVVFVPLNSQLLFSPIKVEPVRNFFTAGSGVPIELQNAANKAIVHNGALCGGGGNAGFEAWRGCGFTPQLVAMHITSVLQQIVSDMFRSTGWVGLVQRYQAERYLSTRPEFKMSEAWLRNNQDFVDRCSGQVSFGQMITGIRSNGGGNAGQDGGGASGDGAPHTFTELWKRWGQIYANNTDHNAKPFIALLPAKAEEAAPYWGEYSRSNQTYVAYENALTRLFQELNPSNNRGKTVSFEPTSPNQVSVERALIDIRNSGFFNVRPGITNAVSNNYRINDEISVNPGFFMMPYVWHDEIKNEQMESRICYLDDRLVSSGLGDTALDALWQGLSSVTGGATTNAKTRFNCLDPSGGGVGTVIQQNFIGTGIQYIGNAAGGLAGATGRLSQNEKANTNLVWSTPANQWETYKFIENQRNRAQRGAIQLPGPWELFLKAYPALETMPVIYGDAVYAEQNRQWQTEAKAGFKMNKFKPFTNYSCSRQAKDLLDEALRKLKPVSEGGVQPDDYLSTYARILNGSETNYMPMNVTTLLNGTGIDESSLRRNFPKRFELIEALANDTHNTLHTSGAVAGNPQVRQMVLIDRYIKILQNVTAAEYQNLNNTAASNAATDGRTMNMNLVGSQTLTNVGGSAAVFVGGWAIWAYSFIIGAVAFATIEFLNVLIDLALFAMVVITPLFLLFGVLQPKKALGYLIISVMVVFVLKFVPISLIILNSVAGMVYELIPSSIGSNASLTQSIMIIGLASLYMGLVGFTLYLLFKSGDAASAIGSLASLDNAAQQMANSGIKLATSLLAIPALAASMGAIFAMAGKFFKGKGGKPGDTAAETPAGDGGGGSGGGKPGDTNTPQRQAAVDTNPISDPFSELSADNANFAMGKTGEDEQFIRAQLKDNPDGYYENTFDKDGKEHTARFSLNNGELVAKISPPLETTAKDVSGKSATNEGAPADTPDANQTETLADDLNASKAPASDPAATQANTPQAKAPAAGAAQKPAQAPAQKAAATTTAPEPKKIKTDPPPLTADEKTELAKIRTPEDVQRWVESRLAADPLKAENYNRLNAKKREDLLAEKNAYLDSLKLGDNAPNAEQQAKLDKYDKDIASIMDYDTTAIRMGNQQMAMQALSNNLQLDKIRGGADIEPGFFKVALSGALGGFKAVGGGFGSIPIIGDVLRGSLNEFYEAPERAKAWQAAGGFMKHWKASGDATRMKFYQQEIAPLAAGFQYQQMNEVGAFQSMATSARFQAAQNVAKMRSEFEAIIADQIGTKGLNIATNTDLTGKVTGVNFDVNKLQFSATDLAGLGRQSAVQNVGSVFSEVAQQQGASWKVKMFDPNETDPSKAMKDVDIKPSVFAMSTIYRDIAVKQSGKQFDAAMVDWYGIKEKHYERDKEVWTETRNMAYSKEAAAKFMAEDISTDYLAAGHLKMVQGKQQFAGYTGQYQQFLRLRNEENGMIFSYAAANDNAIRQGLEKGLKDGKLSGFTMSDLPISFTPDSLKTMKASLYTAVTKVATEGLGGKQFLPLSAIFEEAEVTGRNSILEKSLRAASSISSENERLAVMVAKGNKSSAEGALDLAKIVTNAISIRDSKSGISIKTESALEELSYFVQGAVGSTTDGNRIMQRMIGLIKDDKKSGALTKDDERALFEVVQENKNGVLNISMKASDVLQGYLKKAADAVGGQSAKKMESKLKEINEGDRKGEYKGASLAYEGAEKGVYNDNSRDIGKYTNLSAEQAIALTRKEFEKANPKPLDAKQQQAKDKRDAEFRAYVNDNDELPEDIKKKIKA